MSSTPTPSDQTTPLAALARRARPLGAFVAIVDADGQVYAAGDPHVAWPQDAGVMQAVAAAVTEAGPRMAEPRVGGDGLHILPLAPTEDRRGLLVAVALDADSRDEVVRRALSDVSPSYRRVGRRDVDAIADLHAAMLGLHADLQKQSTGEMVTEDLRRQLCFSFEQLMTLYAVGRMVSTVAEPREFVQQALAKLAEVLDFGWYTVQYLPTTAAHASALPIGLTHGTPPIHGRPLRDLVARTIAAPDSVPDAGILVAERHALARELGGDVVFAPIRLDGSVIGCLVAGDKRGSDPDPSSIEAQLVEAVSDFLGVFHQNLERVRQQHSLTTGTVRALSAAIDAKDPYTRGHSERVGLLTRQLAEAMGFDRDAVAQAHLTGLLHDVGKIGVPEAVLRKPGRLTGPEFDQIKQHPVIGHRILRDIESLGPMLPGVLHHHERIDGGGYPEGLRGEAVPLIARIIAVADGFDAMSSNRAYRDGMPREKVLGILAEGRGTQWDADIVDHFLKLDLRTYDRLIAVHGREIEPDRRDGDAPPLDRAA